MTPDFTIADVLVFARSKPARERYTYTSLDNCALAQFTRYAGVPLHCRARDRLEASDVGMAACQNRTFGGFARALERLVEPSFRKRLWAQFAGKPIEQPTPPSEWTRLDTYMTDIELASA